MMTSSYICWLIMEILFGKRRGHFPNTEAVELSFLFSISWMKRGPKLHAHYCHHCHSYDAKLLACSVCPKQFCEGCLDRRYSHVPFGLNWECPYCLFLCTCSGCVSRKLSLQNMANMTSSVVRKCHFCSSSKNLKPCRDCSQLLCQNCWSESWLDTKSSKRLCLHCTRKESGALSGDKCEKVIHTCHICERLTANENILSCSSAGCVLTFCHSCVKKVEDDEEFLEPWICLVCRSLCPCVKCSSKRKKCSSSSSTSETPVKKRLKSQDLTSNLKIISTPTPKETPGRKDHKRSPKKRTLADEHVDFYKQTIQVLIEAIDFDANFIVEQHRYLEAVTSTARRLLRSLLLFTWRVIVMHVYSLPFLYPVKLEEAPDYLNVITRPMDLDTIRNNIDSLHYRFEFMAPPSQIEYLTSIPATRTNFCRT